MSMLSPEHLESLRTGSGIALEVIGERGYRSVQSTTEITKLGFAPFQVNPGLLIPIRTVDGEIGTYQLRPDVPRRDKDGKTIKYETIAGRRLCLDIPKRVRPILGNPSIPLIVTEGSKKCDSAVSHGLNAIGVVGVWGWRGTNEHGGKTELPCWSAIALNDRHIIIAFDSDVMVKESVRGAIDALSSFLERKGAHVRYAVLGGGNA